MKSRESHGLLPRHFSIILLSALLVSLDVNSGRAADLEASAGYDLFVTDETQTDLLGIPFQGVSLSPPLFDFPGVGLRAIGDTDTIVRRLGPAIVPAAGMTATIPIEILHLNLRSQLGDIDPDGPGGLDPDFLYVTLQKDRGLHPLDPPPGPLSLGTMDVTFDSADGGKFSAQFIVFADLRYGSATGPIVCDVPLPPCADLDAGLPLSTVDQDWGRVPPPASVRIAGVNRHLAGPGDDTMDFWAGVPPGGGVTICVSHGGHPDPGGLPTVHGTCATPCTTAPLVEGTACDGMDSNCDGIIDECAEDTWNPEPFCPATAILECAPVNDVSPEITGFATAADDCNPALPALITNTSYVDFVTPRCGNTFDVDRVWAATDTCGNISFCLQQIHVVDTTGPTFAVPDGAQFDLSVWPPGHGYVVYSTASLVSATDTCGETSVAVTGCHSNQPEEVTQGRTADGGAGDGRTFEDCVIAVDGTQFAVRRERLGACGPRSARIYTVEFTATDECDNQTTAVGHVRIEHDRRDHVPLSLGIMLGPNDPPPFPYLHPTTYGTGCSD